MEQKQELKNQEETMNQNDKPVALSVAQTASILGISVPRAYTLFDEKGFPSLKIGTRKLVMKKDLLIWIDKHKGKMNV